MIDDIHRAPPAGQPAIMSRQPSATDAPVALAGGHLSPVIAGQLAAVIARFWREIRRDGLIGRHATIELLDLCPSAATSSLLMPAIERRLADICAEPVRYSPVLFQPRPAGADRPDNHPDREFASLTNPLIWKAGGPAGVGHLTDNAGRIHRTTRPVVVLAHDAWSRLEQQLYAVHYGKLLRARLDLLASEPGADGEASLWESTGEDAWDIRLAGARARYLTEFNSAPIVYPSSAFTLMNQLRTQFAGPMLVIAFGEGQGDEIGLRLGSFAAVTGQYRSTRRLPLNFPLLADWAQQQGGQSAGTPLGQGRHFQLSVFGVVDPGRWMARIFRCVDPALLAGAEQLATVMKSLGAGAALESRMNLLQLSRHDPAVFLAADKELNAALAKTPDFDRAGWRVALRRVWENRAACSEAQRLHQHLAPVMMRCGDWGYVRQMLQQGMQEQGADPTDLAQLAWCEIRTGELERGASLVRQALAAEPDCPLALQVADRLAGRVARRDHAWHVTLRDERLPLVLEPLDDSHADALLHQYRDPQIAVMTGLPALNNIAEAREWIAASDAEQGKVNFALMHRDGGFAGLINLAISEHAAFFCFWIGVDFQGQGLSSAAGRLVCRHAAGQGVPVMLTSAYKDNHRSIRALRRIGFLDLSIRACPPDHDRKFFSLIDPGAGELDGNAELQAYYQREQLPMVFVPPEADTGAEAANGSHEGNP